MLQARSPGGQLHLFAGGFLAGGVAGSAGPDGVFPGAVLVEVDFGPVERTMGRAVVVAEGGPPVAGAAAADELVSDGVGTGMGVVGCSTSVVVATGMTTGAGCSLVSTTTTAMTADRIPTAPMAIQMMRGLLLLAGGGSEALS